MRFGELRLLGQGRWVERAISQRSEPCRLCLRRWRNMEILQEICRIRSSGGATDRVPVPGGRHDRLTRDGLYKLRLGSGVVLRKDAGCDTSHQRETHQSTRQHLSGGLVQSKLHGLSVPLGVTQLRRIPKGAKSARLNVYGRAFSPRKRLEIP